MDFFLRVQAWSDGEQESKEGEVKLAGRHGGLRCNQGSKLLEWAKCSRRFGMMCRLLVGVSVAEQLALGLRTTKKLLRGGDHWSLRAQRMLADVMHTRLRPKSHSSVSGLCGDRYGKRNSQFATITAPLMTAMAPRVVWAAFRPRRKSSSV